MPREPKSFNQINGVLEFNRYTKSGTHLTGLHHLTKTNQEIADEQIYRYTGQTLSSIFAKVRKTLSADCEIPK